MFDRAMSINPKTAAEIVECETIEGIRRRIQQYAISDSLTRALFQSAYARGLSGEDKMTWLAFEALRRVEHMESLILDHELTHVNPIIIGSKEWDRVETSKSYKSS